MNSLSYQSMTSMSYCIQDNYLAIKQSMIRRNFLTVLVCFVICFTEGAVFSSYQRICLSHENFQSQTMVKSDIHAFYQVNKHSWLGCAAKCELLSGCKIYGFGTNKNPNCLLLRESFNCSVLLSYSGGLLHFFAKVQ